LPPEPVLPYFRAIGFGDYGTPKIFNTDQGAQFTSLSVTGVLREADVQISTDNRGQCMDNIFIERLWRSLKYKASNSQK
jgi:putative transposase